MKKFKWLTLLLSLSMLLPVVACGGTVGDLQEEFEDDGKPYEIVYYMPYNDSNPPMDISAIEQKLSNVLTKKINATIKIHAYTLNEYTTKMSGIIAAGSSFDVCYTSPDVNPYLTNVQREAFLPLDSLLPKYAPETWKAIPSQIWDQARVDGKIYGSVNEQIFPRTYGYNARSAANIQDFLNEKYEGIKPAEVYEKNSDALAFLEEYMQWLKTNKRGNGGKISAINTDAILQNYYLYDNLGTGMATPGVVHLDDDTYTVVNQFETDEYKEMLDTVYDWVEKGYIDESVSSYDLTPDSTWKPGYLTKNLLRLSESHYFTSYVIGTMNAISSTSENPARAMKFIELLRTDEEVHNILQFGIEDIHYVKDPTNPNRIAAFNEGTGYNNKNFGWGLGTEFISYLHEDQSDNLWEETRAINANTEMGALIGFTFEVGKLKQKVADCKAVVNEFKAAFEKGEFKNREEKYTEFINRLNAAGAQEIIAEKQRQLDEFLAKKGLK